MSNIAVINDTLKAYCRSIDQLVLQPKTVPDFVRQEPKPNDQIIVLVNDTPVVFHFMHVRHCVQAQGLVCDVIVVGVQDMPLAEKEQVRQAVGAGEGGNISGIWSAGVLCMGTLKYLDYREWVVRRLSPKDEFNPNGFDNDTLKQLRVLNECINIQLTDLGEPPLLETGCTIKEMISWKRQPANALIPFVGRIFYQRDKNVFMKQWKGLNTELDALRRRARISGLTPDSAKVMSSFVIRIAAFGQSWTRQSSWMLLTLWAMRLCHQIESAPPYTPVDDVLTPVKNWLNDFIFPER